MCSKSNELYLQLLTATLLIITPEQESEWCTGIYNYVQIMGFSVLFISIISASD